MQSGRWAAIAQFASTFLGLVAINLRGIDGGLTLRAEGASAKFWNANASLPLGSKTAGLGAAKFIRGYVSF